MAYPLTELLDHLAAAASDAQDGRRVKTRLIEWLAREARKAAVGVKDQERILDYIQEVEKCVKKRSV